METVYKILLAEDLSTDAEINQKEIRKSLGNCEFIVVETEKDFTYHLINFHPDIIISDYQMPSFDGLSALQITLQKSPLTPFIIVTGSMNEETAVKCMKAGAADYVIKEHINRLGPAVKKALEQKEIQIERYNAEIALHESEKKYCSLFENMLNGYAYCKMIYEKTQPVDFIYLDVNDKFYDLTGLKDVVGKKVSELIPGIKERDPELIEIYGRVASTGRPLKFETYLDSMKMWFSISAYCPQKEYFVTLFDVITERKVSEAALKESEGRYRTFINSSSDMIFLKDELFRHLVVNEKLAEFFGKDIKDVIGKTDFELMDKEHADHCRRTDKAAMAENALHVSEEKIGDRIFESDKFPVELANGKIGIGGYIRDITAKKSAEEKLTEERILMRTLIENIPDAIYIKDTDARKILVNPADLKNIGKNEDEVIGKTDLELFSGEIAKVLYEDDMNVLSGNVIINREEKLVNNVGEVIWLLTTKVPLKNKDGEIIGLVGVGRNITQRKKMDEDIVMLYKAIEQSNNVVIITDPDGIIEYVNPKFSRLTGYNPEEVVGKNPRLLKSGKTSPEEYKILWDTIKSGQEWSGELYNKKKNGEYFWESANISPVKNEDSIVLHFIAVKEDITERKIMIDELKEAKEKAEEMNRLKSLFFANMSHELRTPFVSIIGFSDILMQTLTNPDEKQMAEAIYTSSKRLTGTLNEILNLTKLELNKTEMVIKVFDVCNTINEVFRLYSEPAQKKNLYFKKYIPAEPLIIKTDEQLLREVLDNLIHNAIKFTLEGGIELSAEKIFRAGSYFMILKVKDTGIGIPKSKQNLIWEEFRQVSEGLNRSFEGSGLGLTITKRYVKLMGGTIEVESVAKKGSAFIVELPLTDEPAELIKIENVDKVDEEIIHTKKESGLYEILVVEDDELSRDYVKRVLSKYHKLELVKNAEAALKKIKGSKFDAILMDINLGHGMDGVELTQKIREIPHYIETPIIAMTAYATNNDRIEFLSKGLSHYISKPFTAYELHKIIREALTKK